MGIKYYDLSGLAHWDKPTPVTSMQMQSHAQADRCTSFLPNVWAYEIISAFHLLVRVWFIKWPPTTVLIYKANWCVFSSPLFLQTALLEPPCFTFIRSHRLMDTEMLHQMSWVVECLASALSHQVLGRSKWRNHSYFIPALVTRHTMSVLLW